MNTSWPKWSNIFIHNRGRGIGLAVPATAEPIFSPTLINRIYPVFFSKPLGGKSPLKLLILPQNAQDVFAIDIVDT